MKCSICKLEGHNKRSCKENTASVQNNIIQDKPSETIVKRSTNPFYHTDSSISPSSADMNWLWYMGDGDIHGKWMLFYDRSKIDDEWKRMKELYDSSKLGNVIGMKCSGAEDNPRASNKNQHVIIIYCPDSHEDIMKIGHNIVSNLIDYSDPHIYYKSNIQTREGTKATGQLVNHLYKLETHKQEGSSYTPVISRREMKNIVSKEGYCKCGRKNEEGDGWGCSRYPTCVNVSGEDTWY